MIPQPPWKIGVRAGYWGSDPDSYYEEIGV